MAFVTTVDALVQRVRRDATLASRGAVYTLGDDYVAGGTSLVLNETPSHIGQGSILAVDYELFYVQSTTAVTKTATVIPGYFGTTQANHFIDDLVEVDARFPKSAIADYAQYEILAWGKQLWSINSVDLAIDRATRTYDLAGITGEIYFLLDVRMKPVGTLTDFWNFSWTGDAWPHADARLLRGMSAAEFASGTALQLKHRPGKSTTARIAVAQPFDLTVFDGSTDLVATVGIKENWLDIVELGARYRALASTVVGRSDWRTGNMARNAEEVSTFDTMRATQQAQGLRDLRFADAATELRGDWPYRSG